MEAYLDEEEVVFSSPIGRRHTETLPMPTNDKDAILNSPQTTTSKLWAMGKQSGDDERVFKFDEEESPAKPVVVQRETRGKKTKSRIRVSSRWDDSSSSSDSDHYLAATSEEDKENCNKKENRSANIKELIEIEQSLAKIKLDKEVEASTRLVCSSPLPPFPFSPLLSLSSPITPLLLTSNSSYIFISFFFLFSCLFSFTPFTLTLPTHPPVHSPAITHAFYRS
jgi:hypothetical protein